MRDDRPLVLLTRPKAASQAFSDQLRQALGDRVRILIAPLMEIVQTSETLVLEGVQGLIFTSRNGVEAASVLTPRRDLPAYCVGDATTRAASRAGWQSRMAGVDAEGLVTRLKSLRPAAPLLHLRGEHARGEIAGQLGAEGIEVREQVVYDQVESPLGADALAALRGGAAVIVPLFSPRSARLFASAISGHDDARPFGVAAISQAVADAVPNGIASRVTIAEEPNATAMVGAVEKLVVDLHLG